MKNGVFWFAHINIVDNVRFNSFLFNDGAEAKSLLKEHFKNYHDPISQIIEKTLEENVIKRNNYHGKTLKKWYNERCVAIGDSCHLISPNLA